MVPVEEGNMMAHDAPLEARDRDIQARLRAGDVRKRRRYWIVICLAVATIVVVAVQNYLAIERELTEAAISRRAAVAHLAAVTLTEKLERLVDISVSLSTRVRFRQLIRDGHWMEATELLRAIPQDFPVIDRVVVLDPAGTVMADIPERLELRGRSLADQKWYQGVSRDWKPYVSGVYRRPATPQVNVFVVAAPIRSENGGVAGILLLQTRLDSYFEWTKAVEVGPGGIVYIIDQDGQIAFHPGFTPQQKIVDFSQVPVVRSALRGEHGIAIGADTGADEEMVAAYAAVVKFGWGVIVQQPTRNAFAARNHQLTRLLIGYGLTFVFLALGAYLALRILVERDRAAEAVRLRTELERRVAERTAQLAATNREIEESREQFRAVTETANDAIVSGDVHGNIVYLNRAAEQLLGYTAQEALGRPLTLLMPQRFHAAHQAELKRFLATGQARMIGRTNRLVGRNKRGEEFPMEVSVSQWTTAKGVFFTAILRDVTAREEAAEALKRSNKELQAANKELEGFSYSVSHDLRAPLRAVSGFSKLLLEDHSEQFDAETRRKISVIHSESQRMGVLIDELLAFSQLGRRTIQMSDLDMTQLARTSFDTLTAGNHDGPSPDLDLGELPRANGDRVLMGQVWTNLLSNAIKFSSKQEHPTVTVGAISHHKEHVYFVRDNGAGFDPRYQSKLFGVFQRLHSHDQFPGTGVGLAIVQRIVVRHGGRVWAESQPNEGASFYFSLPKEAAGG
jgi:PAS domain S-box-containing protein